MKCQSNRCPSPNSKLAFAFCSGVSEARNLFAASAIAPAERIRATPSMTDQVTRDNAMPQDDSNVTSLNGFIFDLQANLRFRIQASICFGIPAWEEVALLIGLECDRDFTPSIHSLFRIRISSRFEFYRPRNLDRLLCKPVRQSLDDVNMPYFAVRAKGDNQSHVAFNPILSSRLGVFGLLHINQLRLAHAVEARLPEARVKATGIKVESVFQIASHADRPAVFGDRFESYSFRGVYGLFHQAKWQPANYLDIADIAVSSENHVHHNHPHNPSATRLLRVCGFFSG